MRRAGSVAPPPPDTNEPSLPQAGSGLLFAVAGIAVGPERDARLLGLRRVDIFHVLIAAAALGIAQGMRS